MPAVANLVHEISTTTGTGDFTTSSVNGKQDFSEAFGTGSTTDVFDYFISNRDAAEWERGTGHMSAATTLVRDTVKESTNSNSAVDFSAGTKDIVCDVPADNQVYNENSTVTDGHAVLFDGTTGRKLKSAGAAPLLPSDIGSTVQAYDADLDDWAGKTAPTGDVVGTSDTQTLTNKTIDAASNTITNLPARNRCINPTLAIAQAGVGSTTDGNYTGIDQWYALTQTGAVTSSQLTDVADGVPSMGRLTQSQSTAQRFGWAQPFESAVVKDLRGKTVTLAAKVRMSVATKLRYAIIEWTGTADSVTKDVVASWTNTTFTAGQFFSGTSLTVAGTGSIDLAASTLTDITLSADISSSMNNIVIFFWTDSTQAQTTTLDIGNVFLGQGDSAPAVFDPPSPADDLRACQRYYFKYSGLFYCGATFSSVVYRSTFLFPVTMRDTPDLTVTQNGGGTKVTEGISTICATMGANSPTSSPVVTAFTADARL